MTCTVPDETVGAVARHTLRMDALDRRSNRLARALQRLGVRKGEVVAVVCCEEDEREVARASAVKAGARPVIVSCGTAPQQFASLHRHLNVRVVVACAEGVELWRSAGVAGLILGEGEGIRWWKLAELRESAAPLTA